MRRSTLALTAAWALAAPLADGLLHAQEPSLRPAAGRLLVAPTFPIPISPPPWCC